MGFLQGSSARKAVIAREDWPLLALAGSDGMLPIQLQKSLFLLRQRFPELAADGFYEFRPVGGGDFCEQIYADADSLAKKGLVSVRFAEGVGGRQYRITPAGLKRAKKLEEHLRPALAQSLRKVAAWVNTRTMDQLVRTSTDNSGALPPDSVSRTVVRPH